MYLFIETGGKMSVICFTQSYREERMDSEDKFENGNASITNFSLKHKNVEVLLSYSHHL